jgi:hypothetical protein
MAENTTAGATEATAEEGKKGKKVRKEWTELFPTAEAAVNEAASRTQGPNKAFTAEIVDKNGTKQTYHIVAAAWGRACAIAMTQAGFTCTEIGKPSRQAAKPVGEEGILKAIELLPQDQQTAILAKLAGLVNKPAEAPAAPAPAPAAAKKPAGK